MDHRVSVIIPFFRREKYIDECLDSILTQTRPPHEIILVDDASGPDSLDYLRKYEGVARIIALERNGGPARARNVGAREATGDLIAFQDSDDVWHPRKLERQVALLEENPAYAGAYVGVMVCFQDGREVPYLDKPNPLTLRHLLPGSQVPPSSLLLKTEVFRELGGFDTRFRSSEDFEFTIRLTAAGHQLGFVPEPLLRMRRFGHGNLSSKWLSVLRGHFQVVRRHRSLYREHLGPGADLAQMAYYLRHAGLKRGGMLGKAVYAAGWAWGKMLPPKAPLPTHMPEACSAAQGSGQ